MTYKDFEEQMKSLGCTNLVTCRGSIADHADNSISITAKINDIMRNFTMLDESRECLYSAALRYFGGEV